MNPIAAQPKLSASATPAVTAESGSLLVVQHVMIVELQDERDFTGEVARARFQETQRRRVGVAAGLDREFEVVARIVARRIRREAAGRAMLEALIHRQDHHLAGAAELAVIQHPGQIAQRAWIIAAVAT